ncbi:MULTISPECIES: glycine zipper 2TM domain-containing protein [Larsenimonas]|uniref:Glycine zipper 2TM domain-containing protein n=1 Tax=Larsenimonas suaedae TaxID=1851019 RepID=A0ABU1GZG5_9GAMM|nr:MULTISPECIES: glycine zipper 2TM domain-containing protein [Larsenimonas]MCM2972832.1 glycine zipper 2TM domain-containing protein [Larsenimonas suaedae]MCM5704779.1 glycine zipper 2TM domain-containing protein [Larsenimonas salina]MDR5896931.1 glycine zipper 2TM domain-containing protein [Larsenimonas suaedae]
MKHLATTALVISLAALGGCANSDIYSGDVYSGQDAKTARYVHYGTVSQVRPVKIQAGNQNDSGFGGIGGALLGGVLGSQFGGGSGRLLTSAVGAVGGAVAGSKIEQSANQVNAYEIQIQQDNGEQVVVVQKADHPYSVGQRVRLIGSGNDLSVAPE